VAVLVLDEADHMFDMGFLPDVRRILSALPRRRQNLLFSATMPREIRGLAEAVLRDPAVVELEHSRPVETIDHALVLISEPEKQAALERILAGEDFRSAIVFLRTKRRARMLAELLDRRGHRAVALQGNMSQARRTRALQGFREGRYDVLVATDIAARGLDVAGVSHVVNFDVPGTPDAYTHRIGRTGRSGLAGRALTFATPGDAQAVRAIERRLGAAIERTRLPASPEVRRSTAGNGSAAAARAPRRPEPAPQGRRPPHEHRERPARDPRAGARRRRRRGPRAGGPPVPARAESRGRARKRSGRQERDGRRQR
jgi:ATP-dependent RNA helicase RhlE